MGVRVNRMALDNVGVALDEVMGKGHLGRTCHPDEAYASLAHVRFREVTPRKRCVRITH